MAENLFNQADVNKDQRLDFNEFRNLVAQNVGPAASVYTTNVAGAGPYSTSSYEASSSGVYGDLGGGLGVGARGYGADADLAGATIGGLGGGANYGSYAQASFSSSSGGGNAAGFDGSAGANAAATAAAASASSSSYEASSTQQQVQQYATDAQGLFQDPNPQIVRRPAQGGQVTYTQNIKVRFLQPPPIPPPGPLIIKEVRPPQPPPPPPLVVRQRAPPLPAPQPLILRERPPAIPASVGAQTVVRTLKAVPVPPRSVIIERLPALPPKPRDIIIERWIPYSAMAKRKTIVQRAEAAIVYPKPRNVIIQYEAPQVRVVRQFQRLGITPENPQAYVQRYGTSLFDAQTLVQQARAAGVVEDISAPANLAASSAAFYAESNNATAGNEGAAGASSSSYEASSYAGQQRGAGLSGYESAQAGAGDGGFAASYESNSFSSQGAGAFGDPNAVGYQNYGISTGGNVDAAGSSFGEPSATGYQSYGVSAGGNIDLARAAFNAADRNRDGSIDANEFRQFLGAQNQ